MKTITAKIRVRACSALPLLATAPLAWAQNSIEAFNVTRQGGQILVQVTTRSPLPSIPGSFTVASPARIAFDFPATSNGLGRNSQEIGEGELRSMNVVQSGDRTRLVLNLRNMVGYQAKVDGTNLLITLTPRAQAAAGSAGTARFAEGSSDVTRSGTSTSGAAATARAASSSICRIPPPASTSASRDRTWSSISSRPPCRTSCASASTCSTSPRRCRTSAPSRRATTCAW